jgi:hypothetical protein
MKRWVAVMVIVGGLLAAGGTQGDPPGFEPPSHGFLPRAPKIYARFESMDAPAGKLTLVREKDGQRVTWPVRRDLDVFLHGGLGSVVDLHPGDRVWAVFDPVETKQGYNAVWLLADELGLQTIHDDWFTVGAVDPAAQTVTLADTKGSRQTLPLAGTVAAHRDAETGGAALLRPGDRVRYQTRYQDGQYRVTELFDAMALTRHSTAQRGAMIARLTREGVPGEILPESPGSSAARLLLYRPGGDWMRNLAPGDTLRVAAGGSAPVAARVRRIAPWGEKTSLEISFTGETPRLEGRSPARAFVAHLDPGTWELPPGLGRAKEKGERIDWLLSTIYCICRQGPDTCTGQLYTLSMCEPKSCHLPNAMRERIGTWIDQGRSDSEILRLLEQQEGPAVRRIHLVSPRR